MATVTGFTAARMKIIEDTTVVDGEVQGDNLILLQRNGTPIDAGSVRGPKGDTGAIGQAVAPGIISMYGGQTAPEGYLLCAGQLVSRATYPALFTAIGTVYGAGDGLTNFNVPNLQQRFPIGKGTEAHADVLGEGGGSKDAVVVTHDHPMTHTHNTSGHRHGFDHGHTASSGYEDADHYHVQAAHRHDAVGQGVGTGFAYRTVHPGGGGGYDIINPGGDVLLGWVSNPGTEHNGGGNGTYGQASMSNSTRNTHGHPITVAGTSGAVTTEAGAQALTHNGNTGAATAAVAGTDKNLPPYLVVNFVIKT
jgi:microcystin-dependent protein